MSVTLGSVVLPGDAIWKDEFDWSAAESAQQYSHDGRLTIQHWPRVKGRPISLEVSWVDTTTRAALEAIRDVPGLILTLTLDDGRAFNVQFRHTEAVPLQVTPAVPRPSYDAQDYFDVTINLIEV